MLTVHHLNNSRSQRVLWLLEELGVDYEVSRRSVKNFNPKPFLDGNLQRFQIEESQDGGRVAFVGLKAFDA